MGYVSAMSPCIVCKQVFMYSPTKVPSVLIDGTREPVCESCMAQVNMKRRTAGLPEIVVLPGAYEPDTEEEFGS